MCVCESKTGVIICTLHESWAWHRTENVRAHVCVCVRAFVYNAPSSEEEGDAEGPQPAKLGVSLLVVADVLHELFDRHGLLIPECVSLCREPQCINEDVRIRRDPCHCDAHVVVHLIETFAAARRVQQLRGDPLLGSEHRRVLPGEQTHRCTAM